MSALNDSRVTPIPTISDMSHCLNSLKGGYIGDYNGDYYRGLLRDTRSLDNGSYSPYKPPQNPRFHGTLCLLSQLILP